MLLGEPEEERRRPELADALEAHPRGGEHGLPGLDVGDACCAGPRAVRPRNVRGHPRGDPAPARYQAVQDPLELRIRGDGTALGCARRCAENRETQEERRDHEQEPTGGTVGHVAGHHVLRVPTSASSQAGSARCGAAEPDPHVARSRLPRAARSRPRAATAVSTSLTRLPPMQVQQRRLRSPTSASRQRPCSAFPAAGSDAENADHACRPAVAVTIERNAPSFVCRDKDGDTQGSQGSGRRVFPVQCHQDQLLSHAASVAVP